MDGLSSPVAILGRSGRTISRGLLPAVKVRSRVVAMRLSRKAALLAHTVAVSMKGCVRCLSFVMA